MLYWMCVLGFVWLFGSWRGRRSADVDATVRAICITALLTVPVGAFVGEILGWFAHGSTFDGSFSRARMGIWVGLVVGTASVLWGNWQARGRISAERNQGH
jgi:hypothetical protein